MNSPPFTTLTTFTVLVLIGLALLPLVQTRLLPDRYEPKIHVSFGMGGASAIVVDNEVTSKLEGVFSRLQGLTKLESRTWQGGGGLVLHLDEQVDLDAVRFEVAALIRQLYPQLPAGVSYPQVGTSGQQDEDRPELLMGFTLSGAGSNTELGAWARTHLVPVFGEVAGVQEVMVYGAYPYEWELVYDTDKLRAIGLEPSKLGRQVRQYFQRADLGAAEQRAVTGEQMAVPVIYAGHSLSGFDPQQLQIWHGGRLFQLTELVSVRKVSQEPQRYERINGLEAVNVMVTARGSANFIVSADDLRQMARTMAASMPAGYSLRIHYDASEFIKDELRTILLRVGASLFILLLFVYLVSRSVRYFVVVTLSILVNVAIAFSVYYLLGVTIHLYSLAGIAISLGIVIDNTIVVVDQLRNRKGMQVMRAVVAATLTTIGSLVVVWFLDAQTQLKLIDFCWVVIVNLSLSVLVSGWFTPALLAYLPLHKVSLRRRWRKSRRVVRFSLGYARVIWWLKGKRWLVWLVLILGFGLPVFMLPAHLKGTAFYIGWYNHVLGSRTYRDYIRPVTDVALGGVLRLFVQENSRTSFHQSEQRTVLNVTGTMDDGTTLPLTNAVFQRIENFLLPYEQIEQFQTSIYSPSSARLTVHFKPEAEHSGFPHQLKSELERFCIDLGGADWQITGVGRGFDNSLHEGRRNNRMILYGYNLDQLKAYADQLKSYLVQIERVDSESIFVNGRATYDSKIRREYEMAFDEDKMRATGIASGAVLTELHERSEDRQWVFTAFDEAGRYENVYLKAAASSLPDLWEFSNQQLDLGGGRHSRFQEFGQFGKQRQQQLINKEDMQYTMVVEFDFIGSWGQQQYFLGQVTDRMKQQLPIGYFLKPMQNFGGVWGEEESGDRRIWLILLVTGIIYLVSAVVFGSLIQPLLVILLIPVSFIGSFLTFHWFDIPFNEGGFAALILLSGLTVNSVIYILNDLNHLRKTRGSWNQERLYLKAFNQMIIPILLTVISTVLGLAPFLVGNESSAFWVSLSAGTIGGLLFSIVGLMIVLPVFVKRNKPVDRLMLSAQAVAKKDQEGSNE